MNNLKWPIIHEETEVVLKIIPTKKAQEQIVLMQTFYQKYQEELIPILKNMILTIETEESLPNTFFESTVTLIAKPQKESNKIEKYCPISHMNIKAKMGSDCDAIDRHWDLLLLH